MMKLQSQVETEFSRLFERMGFHYGAATCPYCNIATPIRKHGRGYLYADNKCEHAKGAVDGGKIKIAVHFETMAQGPLLPSDIDVAIAADKVDAEEGT